MFNKNQNVMKDYISLSTTPGMEDCAAMNDDNYMRDSRLEARVYQRQLQREYGTPPPGTEFRVKRCPHDFGTYLDLEFHYDDEDQRHVAYMADVDNGCLHWDDKALRELKQSGYSKHILKSRSTKRKESEGNMEDDEAYSTDNGPTGHGDICYSDADPGL
jgi:hypothetical protein